jgi:hypothetical protein
MYVMASENLLVPVRRKEIWMAPRVKQLTATCFTPTEVLIKNVPNARYLWNSTLKVMKKQGIMYNRPVRTNGKSINAYKMAPDMCVEAVLNELKCTKAEGEWLMQVTTSAGRRHMNQKLMDDFMTPKKVDCVVDLHDPACTEC